VSKRYMRTLLGLAVAVLLPLFAACSSDDAKPRPTTTKSVAAPAAPKHEWTPIVEDDLHDRENPEIGTLQNPVTALSVLPRHGDFGNKVDWMASLEQGLIEPRATLTEKGKLPRIDILVLLNTNGGLPIARFPHKQHTAWLDCGSCHQEPFEMRAGDTRFGMLDIMEGRFCGKCHGAVAFPIADCARCHSVKHEDAFRWVAEGKCQKKAGKNRQVVVCPNPE